MQVIKRYIMHSKKTAFIVEHDFIMAAYLADRVIVYEGIPSKEAVARCPQSLLTGAPPLGCTSEHPFWYSMTPGTGLHPCFLAAGVARHLYGLCACLLH